MPATGSRPVWRYFCQCTSSWTCFCAGTCSADLSTPRTQAKERELISRGMNRPGSSQYVGPDGKQLRGDEQLQDLEDEDVMLAEDDVLSCISSVDSTEARREVHKALRRDPWEELEGLSPPAPRHPLDPPVGDFSLNASRPCVLSAMVPGGGGARRGVRREDLDIAPEVTDAALIRRDEAGAGEGREGTWGATLLNGCSYQGEWRGGLPHGHGSLSWTDGTTYVSAACLPYLCAVCLCHMPHVSAVCVRRIYLPFVFTAVGACAGDIGTGNLSLSTCAIC